MPERVVYKRQKKKAKQAAAFLVSAAAVCVLFGGFIESGACLLGAVGQSRISLARERSFAKITAGAGDFAWHLWSNARCSVVCHMARNHLTEVAEKFVRPALASKFANRFDDDLRVLQLKNRCLVGLLEATVTLFGRFASRAQWELLAPLLGGYHPSRYKLIFKDVLDAVSARWLTGGLLDLTKVPLHGWKRPGRRDTFADWAISVFARSGASPRVIGFIDGTFRPVCRPGGDDWLQRLLYNGYEGTHGLKYQSFAAPCGLIFDMFGPVVGSHSDSTILALSGLESKLQVVTEAAGVLYIAYADSAYAMSEYILRGCKRHMIFNAEHQLMQTSMNSARTSVEWGFGIVGNDWQWVHIEDVQKVLLSPCGLYFKVATVLSNIKTCLNAGNLISDFFDCPPPFLDQYLDMATVPAEQ